MYQNSSVLILNKASSDFVNDQLAYYFTSFLNQNCKSIFSIECNKKRKRRRNKQNIKLKSYQNGLNVVRREFKFVLKRKIPDIT